LGVVESKDRTLIKRVARAALHTIHSLFPPPEITGHVGGKDSISKKKCDQGDAQFERVKEILGFCLDGEKRTASLPPPKAIAIDTEITRLLRKKHVGLKRMQVIVGKIIHVTQILPTAKAFLSPIYSAMAGDPPQVGLGTKSEVRAALLDLRTMVKDLARRPTHMAELVTRPASKVGMCDASSTGVGGIWLMPGVRPMVWRMRWPDEIYHRYKAGEITNSDLEQAGIVLAMMALESVTDMRHTPTRLYGDNSPSVSWSTRLVSKSKAHLSHRLIRAMAMRLRTLEAPLPQVAHWPGDNNEPADIASRSFDPTNRYFRPSDPEFLTLFSSLHPTQIGSWRLVSVDPGLRSKVISTVLGARLPLQQWTGRPASETGPSGSSTRPIMANPTPSCPAPPMPTASKCWSASLPATVRASLGAAVKSGATPLPLASAMSPLCLN
jgi:hypothetical protein